MVSLTRSPIDAAAVLESVRPQCGGVCLFLGTVRDLTGDEVTIHLDYDAYPPMAEKKLAEIERVIRDRWPAEGVALIHRLGRIEVGEISVAVAVACPHRDQAFAACRYGIDAIKELVPIWKKDFTPGGAAWKDGA
jgi:molybdopterin synthase catalytic subunit